MLALLIDAENLSAEYAPQILSWARSRGPLIVVRLFGDYLEGRLADWCSFAREHGLEIAFQPSGGARKNSTDIALTIQAMDLLHEGVVSAFCLASSDRDFLPLAARIRRAGKSVYVVGRNLDERMRSAGHDFLDLKPIEGPFLRAFREASAGIGTMPLSGAAKLLRQFEPRRLDGMPKRHAAQNALKTIPQLELFGTAPDLRVRLRGAF